MPPWMESKEKRRRRQREQGWGRGPDAERLQSLEGSSRGLADDPGGLKALGGGWPLILVEDEDGGDELLGLVRDAIPIGAREVVVGAHDLFKDLLVVVAIERGETTEPIDSEIESEKSNGDGQNVCDDTNGPDVNTVVVGRALENLRGHVVRGTARGLEGGLTKVLGESKVGDLEQ